MTALETPSATSVTAPKLRPAPPPLVTARAGYVGAVLALLTVGIGAVGIRDAALTAGWLNGNPLLPNIFGALVDVAPRQWMLPAGAAAVLLGAWLVHTALLPRRPAAVPVDADSPVYVGFGDVARAASATALDVPGVLAANSRASARRVTVRCRVTGDEPSVRALVADAVSTALDPLHRPTRTVVRVRRKDRS